MLGALLLFIYSGGGGWGVASHVATRNPSVPMYECNSVAYLCTLSSTKKTVSQLHVVVAMGTCCFVISQEVIPGVESRLL